MENDGNRMRYWTRCSYSTPVMGFYRYLLDLWTYNGHILAMRCRLLQLLIKLFQQVFKALTCHGHGEAFTMADPILFRQDSECSDGSWVFHIELLVYQKGSITIHHHNSHRFIQEDRDHNVGKARINHPNFAINRCSMLTILKWVVYGIVLPSLMVMVIIICKYIYISL